LVLIKKRKDTTREMINMQNQRDLKKAVAPLYRSNIGIFIRDLVIDWLIIAASYYMVFRWPRVDTIFPALFIIGTRQHALAVLGHEGAHGRISKNKRLNDVIAGVVGFWPLGSGLRSYKQFHLQHHRHLGTWRDPELRHKYWHRPYYDVPISKIQLLRQWVCDLFGLNALYVARVGFSMRPRALFDFMGCAVFWGVVFGVAWKIDAFWVPILWFAALITSFWLVFHVRIWFEHSGVQDTWRIEIPAWFRVIVMPHNIGYHYEHHHWPFVAYMNLPIVRQLDRRQDVISWGAYWDILEKLPASLSGAPSTLLSSEFHAEPPLKGRRSHSHS
jgi:fatty acid desaturase